MSARGGLWTCPRPHVRPDRPRRSTWCWRVLCACAGSGRDAPTTLTLTPLLLLARGAARCAGEPGARALGRAAGGAGQPRQRERERDPGRRAARQRPLGRPGRRDDVRQGQDPERVRAGRRQRAVRDCRQVRAAAPRAALPARQGLAGFPPGGDGCTLLAAHRHWAPGTRGGLPQSGPLGRTRASCTAAHASARPRSFPAPP